MNTDSRLGVCVVGAGAMGEIHAGLWRDLPWANVVAVADPDPGLARALARRCGAAAYADYRRAVDRDDVNVVSICTPTRYHPEIALHAAARGRHILCEKPIALSLAEADAMIAAAAAARVQLAIGFMRRYSPVWPSLRQWASREAGRPMVYHVENVFPLRLKRAMHDARLNGGPFIDMFCHYSDTWSQLFAAPPVTVMAQGLVLARDRPELAGIDALAPDSGAVIVRYASGDIGSYVVTWGLPPGAIAAVEIRERIFAPGGMVQLRFSRERQEVMWHGESGESRPLAEAGVNLFQREIGTVADCLRHQRPVPVDGHAGREALRVSLAALASMERGEAVHLAHEVPS